MHGIWCTTMIATRYVGIKTHKGTLHLTFNPLSAHAVYIVYHKFIIIVPADTLVTNGAKSTTSGIETLDMFCFKVLWVTIH